MLRNHDLRILAGEYDSRYIIASETNQTHDGLVFFAVTELIVPLGSKLIAKSIDFQF